MDDDLSPTPLSDEQTKTVSAKVLEVFLDELSQQPDMEEVSTRLRDAFFNGEAITDNSLRNALFNETEQ